MPPDVTTRWQAENVSIYAWEPIAPSAVGTLCAGCWARGVGTMHSPAGAQHEAWEAKWAGDPSWWPEKAPEPAWPWVPAGTRVTTISYTEVTWEDPAYQGRLERDAGHGD